MKTKPQRKKKAGREPEEITLGEHVAQATKATAKAEKKAKAPKSPKAAKRESMEAELERLRREIKARDLHEKKGRKLADECRISEANVDSCKANTAAAKVELAEANKKLAAHVRGEVPKDAETGKQQTMVAEKPKGKVEPLIDPMRDGAEACKAGKPPTNPYKDEQAEAALWITGYLDQCWKSSERRKATDYAVTAAALIAALIPKSGLPPGEAHPTVKAIKVMGYWWLVVDGWSPTSVADCAFAVVQLVKKDDWRDLWGKAYGPPIPGVDASDEAKANRQKGGVDCARVVHLEGVDGDYVVAPREASMVLVAPRPKAAAVAAAAKHDAKAAAAGDDHDDESDD